MKYALGLIGAFLISIILAKDLIEMGFLFVGIICSLGCVNDIVSKK